MSSLLTQNFYELFRLSPSYSIDNGELAIRYRELQQTVHPDRFVTAADAERRVSMQLAAHVNEAYQTLKHPLSRARYLLEIYGVNTDHGANLSNDFLVEQMELRERLENLVGESQPLVTLMDLRDDLENRLRDLQQTFASHVDSKELDLALCVFNKMQFFYRLQEELDQKEEQLSE